MRQLERKMRYYEKRAQMTDEQVAAERERLAAARRGPKPRRAISLKGL